MDIVRKLDTTGSPRKKPRGARRKLQDMRRAVRKATVVFPSPEEESWRLRLPVPRALVAGRRPVELPGARIAASWSLGEIGGFSERSCLETIRDDGVPGFSELHYIGELGAGSA